MKKFIVTVLLSLAIVCCVLGIVACNNKDCRHTKTKWVVEKQATCSEKGQKKEVCSRCGVTLGTEEVEKLAHTETKIAAVPATCTEDGATEGKRCAVCGANILIPQTAPALGHNMVDGECTRCGYANFRYKVVYGKNGNVEGYSVVELLDKNIVSAVIPAEYRNQPVVAIADAVFQNCQTLKTVGLPQTLTQIGEDAFAGCDELYSVSFENGSKLKSIGARAFRECFALTGFDLPYSVTYIGANAFEKCELLRLFNIPVSSYLEILDNSAFADCISLAKIELPSKVRAIGDSVFYGCTSLKIVVLSSHLEEIGTRAFADCTALANITIPAAVTELRVEIFYGCSALESITVAAENTHYKSVDGNLYSADGKVLLQYAVGKTEETFTVPDGVETVADGAFCQSKLKTVVLPQSVTVLGANAFRECHLLTSVNLPSVTTIGSYCFCECETIKSIVLEQCVESVGTFAFVGCDGLHIYCKGASDQGWDANWNISQCPVVWNYSGN